MVYLYLLFLILILFSLLIYKLKTKQRAQEEEWLKESKRRLLARIEETEEGIFEWLDLLKLPQFEEETTRREAAHRLCIVLSERLMRWPKAY